MDGQFGEVLYSCVVVFASVLARPIPKGTVPFGASNVPFGSAPKPAMCPLGQPQNRQFSFCIQQPLKLLELMKTDRPLKLSVNSW